MAARLDYLERTQDDLYTEEMQYCDLVLVGHGRWAQTTRGPNTPIPMGELLGIPSIIEGRYELRLSHDEFTMVDASIAVLVPSLREIVELEYQCLFRKQYHSLSQEDKWRTLRLKRTEYATRLGNAKCMVHHILVPHIVIWRVRGKRKL